MPEKGRDSPVHRLPDWRLTLPLAQSCPRCGARTRRRVGRGNRAKTYGKKREHGRNSYNLMLKEQIPFRMWAKLLVCCVQSWRATYIGWNDGRT